MKNKSTWYLVQIASLIIGSLIAWITVIRGFINFYAVEGTIFKVVDCNYTNPFITPCFWGAMAFLIALIWSITLYTKRNQDKAQGQERGLLWLLVASTIFGWSNVGYEQWLIIKAQGEAVIGCSGAMTSIFQSPCLYGSIFFLLAMLATVMIVKNNKEYS